MRAVRPLVTDPYITLVAYGEGKLAYFDMRKYALLLPPDPSPPPVIYLHHFHSFTHTFSPTASFQDIEIYSGTAGITGMRITNNAVMYSVNHSFLYKYPRPSCSSHTVAPQAPPFIDQKDMN